MNITLVGKMKNGMLWEGVKKLGNQAKLAEYLGVSQSMLGRWLNMQEHPSQYYVGRIEPKIMKLLDKTFEDVFPAILQSQDFLDKNKNFEITKNIPVKELIECGLANKALPSPEEDYFEEEKKDLITKALETLTIREEKIIKMHYGLEYNNKEHTLEEIGLCLDLTKERIRGIETKAIGKLKAQLKCLINDKDYEEWKCSHCGTIFEEGSRKHKEHIILLDAIKKDRRKQMIEHFKNIKIRSHKIKFEEWIRGVRK